MENLVQAWQLRVESLSNEISQKRAGLSQICETILDLQAVQEEEERLLTQSSKYLSDLSIERAQLAKKVLLIRTNQHKRNGYQSNGSCGVKNPPAGPSSASAQRILLTMESEKARMDAHDALADEAAAEVDQVKQQLRQDLDQVVAETKAIEEEVQGTEALLRSSAAEKDALLREHAKLQSDLDDLVSKSQALEQENATMRAQALKRAQRQTKGVDARPGSNSPDGDLLKKVNAEAGTEALLKLQRRRDAASTRLNELRRLNADADRRLDVVERQIADAQQSIDSSVSDL